MKTFAELKRTLQVGTIVTMVKHSWFANGGLIGYPRKIEKVQTNGIQFESVIPGKSGSWLSWPGASSIRIIDEKTFQVSLKQDGTFEEFMEYLIA